MYIKYNPEEINLEVFNITLIDLNNPEFIKPKPTFNLTDVGHWNINSIDYGKVISKVNGNIQNFIDMNTDNYIIVDSIPLDQSFIIDIDKTLYTKIDNLDDVLKLKARERINDEVGDIYDLISDVSKRLSLVERLLMYTVRDLLETSSEKIPFIDEVYRSSIEEYLYFLSITGHNIDIADLEDQTLLFRKLIDRTMQIKDIVNEEYLTKKD